MRPAFYPQTCISAEWWLRLEPAQELRSISELLDRDRRFIDLIHGDLLKVENATGAEGLSAEQVLRALLIKQMKGFSYRELAFALCDSRCYSRFCRLNPGQHPSKSALAAAIKALQPQTLDAIHQRVLVLAVELEVEEATTMRVDCTVTRTLMHPPSDSLLLVDSLRVLARNQVRAGQFLPDAPEVVVPLKRAKQCARAIATLRRGEERADLYRELFEMTRTAIAGSQQVLTKLDALTHPSKLAGKLIKRFQRFLPRIEKVLGQAERRVLGQEQVPSRDKLVSIFEEHTDVIVKSWNDVHYGHKVCLVTGKTMILDTWVLDGNPCDSTLAVKAVERACAGIGVKAPKQVVFDGSFRSKENLAALKAQGIKDVVFTKHRGIELAEMVADPQVFHQLRDFRAGIEGCISFLKRTFGLDRCTWRTLESFRAYVAAAMVACNLLLLARSQLR